MNGMWTTLAAEVLDRNKLSAWAISVNVGTHRNPVWEAQPDILGIMQAMGPGLVSLTTIPNLNIDAIGN